MFKKIINIKHFLGFEKQNQKLKEKKDTQGAIYFRAILM